METITIIPNNKRQGKVIKALLKEMNVPFLSDEDPKISVSDAAKESIQKGLEDAVNGELISEEEVNKHFQNVIRQMD
ncbi:MAG: hypothetical protein GX371_07100 [Bacteroidales bacterium]|nr:hypothetical protein [Bacteroidales bacterium]